ncbi:MAG: hypothetical protein EU542_07605 [Promethearchaeota archaeon]|nr:MAG: hypothetical protein EU542_07605 [Candidatus Lokiarchaeota archaeon]
MKFKKIEIARQSNFILATLLLHFVFFGYLSNVYRKAIGDGILFLYQVLFNPASFFSVILLIGIVFIMAIRETFYEYGIKNSVWLVPFIMIESWIWYLFINGSFNILGTIGYYFTSIEAYITIFVLIGINLSTALIAVIIKERYKIYKKV